MKKTISLILMLVWFLVTIGLPGSAAPGDPPQNVIFLIGDGMGFEQVRAAGMYLNGIEGTLSFEILPYQAEMTTYSANSSVTDSAAAATAMATGVKVNNGVVSVEIPGDVSELETLLEYLRDRGKSTGLVTTTNMTHATPACFGAHDSSRYNTSAIATDYLNQTRPNVLFGGGESGMDVSNAEAAGYTVVTDAFEMLALDTALINMASGQFGSGSMPFELDGLGDLPHLSEMTEIALDILDNDPDGFFLMVEGGRIDHAGHLNDIQRNVHETIEFSYAVQEVIDWAAGRANTLILVTADHETGGLTVIANNGAGNYPTVSWSTGSHTGVNVPLYAWGVNAELILGEIDNTELFAIAVAPASPYCLSDIDNDDDVDGSDLAVIADEFGRTDCVPGDPCNADLDNDGDVDDIDIFLFAEDFGRTDC
jgi:alkaline phosphatase